MEHIAKPRTKRIKPAAQPSKNAIALRMIEEVFPEGKIKGGYMFPAHTEPGASEVFGLMLGHADTIRSFEKVCEKNNLTFSEGVELALRHYPFHLAQKKTARKKYRERKERDQDRASAFMGDFYDEIMEADRSKCRAAEFWREDSRIPAKPINDAAFLSDLGILDDGLEPASS